MSAREELREVKKEGLLGDLLDRHTWGTAAYVLLAFPAGVLGATLLTGGVVAGVLTLPVLLGAALLLGSLWLVGGLADAQRVLARLLGVTFARPALPPSYTGVLPWLRGVLSEGATYRALLFHVVQLPLAALSWAVLGGLLTLTAAGLSSPLWLGQPGAPLAWKGAAVQAGPLAHAGGVLLGLGGLLLTGGVLNLMGRVWSRLARALLAPDEGEAARREVLALRRAAGRVALGDDLGATLHELTRQARAASTARAVALLTPTGTVRASSGPVPDDAASPPPVPGEVRVWVEGGRTLADLPVTLPAGVGGGTLRAVYPAGLRPGADELAFLVSMADHAGTALHAAELIERASRRAGEEERARLARELHDSVAQALYGITLGAKTARAALERDPSEAGQARTQASLDYTIRLAEGGVSEMKALLFSLRPDALEEGGLVAALTQHAHALEARHGLTVHADLGSEPCLTPDAQAAAYRVAQEALHNVVKHARASQVWLTLRENGGTVTLTVRDDGRGFDPQAQGRGTLGQRSMRERAAGAGGTLTVDSAAGAGTAVTLTLPATGQGEGAE